MNVNLKAILKRREKEHIIRCLDYYNWHKPATAVALGIGESSLYRKMEEHDISTKKPKGKKWK